MRIKALAVSTQEASTDLLAKLARYLLEDAHHHVVGKLPGVGVSRTRMIAGVQGG